MDFYSDDLSQIALVDVKSFLCLDCEESQRPTEGPTIEYKEMLPQDIGDDVAALSNTYGGLIFIGVKSNKAKQNIPIAIVDSQLPADCKARISDKIFSTVHPRPQIDIGVAESKVVVIRVREGTYPPYEFSQGATIRIPIRTVDNNRQASVREIESLLAKRDSLAKPASEILSQYFAYLPGENSILAELGPWQPGPRQQAICVPKVPLQIAIDRVFERRFEGLVATSFSKDRAYWKEFRRAGFYMLFYKLDDQIRIWEAWSSGVLRFRTTLRAKEPVGDLADDLIRFFWLCFRLLDTEGYYGRTVVAHEIVCPDVKFLPTFPPHYDRYPGISIPESKLDVLGNAAHFDEESPVMDLKSPEAMVAKILHEELRDMWGVRIELETFEKTIKKLSLDIRSR